MKARLIAVSASLMLLSCNLPRGLSAAPKIIMADGAQHVACSGFVTVYHPSRDVSSSSEETYEITFTDVNGKWQDLKQVRSYSILEPDPDQPLTHALPAEANPYNTATTYSNGQPIAVGAVVVFKDGEAKWLGPGKWEALPCRPWWNQGPS
jgi:hypothetical protein